MGRKLTNEEIDVALKEASERYERSGAREWNEEPATVRQLAFLKVLGWEGTYTPNKGQAARLIERLKSEPRKPGRRKLTMGEAMMELVS